MMEHHYLFKLPEKMSFYVVEKCEACSQIS